MTEADKGGEKETKKIVTKEEKDNFLISDINLNLKHLEKSFATEEVRLTTRSLRNLGSIRRRINSTVLRKLIEDNFGNFEVKKILLGLIANIKDEKDFSGTPTTTTTTSSSSSSSKIDKMDIETPKENSQITIATTTTTTTTPKTEKKTTTSF